MSLIVAEFERGVAYWLEQTKWDRDFHNGFYKTMAAVNPHGNFDDFWWAAFLPELHRWRATRGRSGDFLTPRARVRFARMSQAWAAVVEPNLGSDIEGLQWSDVSAFPAIVAEIKDVDSPVFASKFCHFLAPRVFPLVDNAAMGNEYFTYADCFRAYKREWMTTTAKGVREELVARLADLVGPGPAPDYPFKHKTVELSDRSPPGLTGTSPERTWARTGSQPGSRTQRRSTCCLQPADSDRSMAAARSHAPFSGGSTPGKRTERALPLTHGIDWHSRNAPHARAGTLRSPKVLTDKVSDAFVGLARRRACRIPPSPLGGLLPRISRRPVID